jgi:hypothetical protein
MGRFRFFRGIKFVIFLVLFLTIGGFITMNLWNWLIPDLFHGPVINFWQTVGLLVLSKILFGGFGRGGWKGRGRDRGWNRGGRFNNKCGDWNENWNKNWKENWRENWKEKMAEKMKEMSEEEREKFKEKFEKKFNFTVNL